MDKKKGFEPARPFMHATQSTIDIRDAWIKGNHKKITALA